MELTDADVTAVQRQGDRVLYTVSFPGEGESAVIGAVNGQAAVARAVNALAASTSDAVARGRLVTPHEVSPDGQLAPRPDLIATVRRILGEQTKINQPPKPDLHSADERHLRAGKPGL